MRALTDGQWERYFELIAHLETLSTGARAAALQAARSQRGGTAQSSR